MNNSLKLNKMLGSDPRAFTLIEIVMVLVILAMLAGIALPKYYEQKEQAKIDLTKQNLQNLRMAINFYHQTYGYGSCQAEELNEIVNRKFIEEIPLEAITNNNMVRQSTFVDGTGGWLWDSSQCSLKVNLNDDPTDPRKRYSEW